MINPAGGETKARSAAFFFAAAELPAPRHRQARPGRSAGAVVTSETVSERRGKQRCLLTRGRRLRVRYRGAYIRPLQVHAKLHMPASLGPRATLYRIDIKLFVTKNTGVFIGSGVGRRQAGNSGVPSATRSDRDFCHLCRAENLDLTCYGASHSCTLRSTLRVSLSGSGMTH